MAKDITRRSILLSTINAQYVELVVNKLRRCESVSQFMNELIDERRRNETFDSCQNQL